MSAPLYERLRAYAKDNRISFAMPGHKNGRGIRSDLLSLDVTELSATENLHNPRGYVKSAQKLLSELYGSDKSYILTGGSTAAVHAMILGAVKKGGTLLADSACHMSVVNICAVVDFKIRFIPTETDGKFGVPKGLKTVKEYITDDTEAVIITSPNYYGLCADVENIARECHEKGIPLLVDEAHGAHFIADSRLPETAVRYADAVAQSAHKTLNALNGAAYLHVNGGLIDRARLARSLGMVQSSSPSYVIAASADTAREELSGKNGWSKNYDRCARLRRKLAAEGIGVLDNDDITRLVLNFSDYDATGFEVSERLSENKIDVEAADLFNIVLIVTPSNTNRDTKKLCRILRDVVKGTQKRDTKVIISQPPAARELLSPSKSFFAKNTWTELKAAAGRVAAAAVTPYPPGVPVIHMGERIRAEQIEYIETLRKTGAEIVGLEDGKISVETENERDNHSNGNG